jgi:hypothetical protein
MLNNYIKGSLKTKIDHLNKYFSFRALGDGKASESVATLSSLLLHLGR